MDVKLATNDPIERILASLQMLDTELAELIYPYMLEAMQRGIAAGAAELGIPPSWDVHNPEVVSWVRQYTGLLSNRVNTTLIETVRDVLTTGIAEGWGVVRMSDEVIRRLGVMEDARGRLIPGPRAYSWSERIIRTETARAQNAGREKQLKRAGAKRKVWKANQNACPFCRHLDGRTISIDEIYFARGDTLEITIDGQPAKMKLDYSDTPHPPLHPNCRCITAYLFEGETE